MIVRSPRILEVKLALSTKLSLSIRFRKFNYQNKRFTKKHTLVAVPRIFLPYKECVITVKKRKTKQTRPAPVRYYNVLADCLIIMGVVGFICFSSSIQAASNTQLNLEPDEVKSNVVTPNVQESFTLSKSVPVTIQIPAIGLDLPVRAVGQSADGSIATPDVLKYEAGWYQYSPTPGEKGPAVIVGHVDNYKGPSVFWRLRELKPEDTIKVTRTDGTVANFMVLSLEQFEQDRLPIQKLYGDTDYASLRLITCGGIFNRQSGQYTHNTVVFAKMSNDSSPVVR